MNTVQLIGRVGQAPKTVVFPSGKKVIKVNLAVKDFAAGESGTMWIEIEAWNELGDRVVATVTKGREIAVTGRLAVTSFLKSEDGETHRVTKPVVRLTGFYLCGRRPVEKLDMEESA